MTSVFDYHDRTKHHFHRFARSLGYLDWSSQPDPFRRYEGARTIALPRTRLALDVPYDQLYRVREDEVGDPASQPAALTPEALAEFLRCSLGLSAWKQYGASRWALRVNPSSGNLHPTEGYVVTGAAGLCAGGLDAGIAPAVFHYAPREHALEERAVLGPDARDPSGSDWSDAFLVGLASVHWREAWKYGERAFRYCQHDAGHAIAALRYAAALFGWQMALLPRWSDLDVSMLLGLDLHSGPDAPEREWPDCLAVVSRGDVTPFVEADPDALVGAARRASWRGTPNPLSSQHEEWPIIDEVADATRFPGLQQAPHQRADPGRRHAEGTDQAPGADQALTTDQGVSTLRKAPAGARAIILQRRSALGFDGRGTLPKTTFLSMLRRLRPGAPPWDAIWWDPQVHLVLFVHRVEGLPAGMYAYLREPDAVDALRAACREDLLWEAVSEADGLFLLVPLDCRSVSRRLSCDQDIAAQGFFGLAMIARFEESLRSHGEWFYRNLFWECGIIGQVLYLEAEAAGARATGIGCYYDDPVHDLLGLTGRAWQSLYHFSMGVPVEDVRLTTEPGYPWDSRV